MPTTILLLNGPNLNVLGAREPEIYGSETLQDIETKITKLAQAAGFSLICKQSNREYELLDLIHTHLTQKYHFAIINPGAWTHTSVALRDAFLAVKLPFIEVHLSNVYQRESFRHHSYLSDVAEGVIVGMGSNGYTLALQHIIHQYQNRAK